MKHSFHTRPQPRASAAALTLIELLVALALVGIVLAAAGSLLLSSFSNDAAYRQQNNVQQQARYATDIVADDLKGAKRYATVVTVGTTKATLPTNTVQGLSASNIASHTAPLYCNVFDDAGAEKRVRYWLNGTDLRREVVPYVDEATTPGAATGATGGVVVARNMTTFTARRVAVSGNVLDPGNYHLIQLDIVATDPPVTGALTTAQLNTVSRSTVTTNVTLRNNLL